MTDYKMDKDALAFANALRTAESGQAKAQYMVGLMYANGFGTPQDFEQALFWYRKSAAKSYAPAQSLLAGKYVRG